jgi:hypothetical protein
MRLTIKITTIGLLLLCFGCQQQKREAEAVKFDRIPNFADTSGSVERAEYLQGYRQAYNKQLQEVRKAYPLVLTHLRLLEAAYMNRADSSQHKRRKAMRYMRDVYQFTGGEMYTLASENETIIYIRDDCGTPDSYFRADKVGPNGEVISGRDMETSIQMWIDCTTNP